MVLSVKVQKRSAQLLFAFEEVKEIEYLPIVNPEGWEACIVEFRSPLWGRLQFGGWLQLSGVFMLAATPVQSLLKTAAEQGFWQIPKTGLNAITKELHAELPESTSFVDVLFNLVGGTLQKELTYDNKLRILRLRMPEANPVSRIAAEIQKEDGQDMVDEGDMTDMTKADCNREALTDAEVGAAIREIAISKHSEPAASGQASSSSSTPAKKPRKWPSKIVLEDKQIKEQSNSYLPSGMKLCADAIDRSWRLECCGKRYSRAWRMYGQKQAALMLIKQAWETALQLGFESKCPFAELGL